MSYGALERVVTKSRQDGSHLALLLLLAFRANPDSVCWIKHATLMRALKLEKRQVQNLLDKVVEEGEAEVRRNEGGEHLANYYLVTVGDPSVRWPDVLPEQRGRTGANLCRGRVQSAAANGCNSLPARSDGCNSSRGPVQFSAADSKESESQIELTILPSNVAPPVAPSRRKDPARVPAELRGFDELLRPLPGYLPTKQFFERVVANYAGLDLVEEAIAIVDWFDRPSKRFRGKAPREAGELCSNSRVLRWLKRAKEQQKGGEAGSDNHGAAFGGSGGGPAGDGGKGGAVVPGLSERWDI